MSGMTAKGLITQFRAAAAHLGFCCVIAVSSIFATPSSRAADLPAAAPADNAADIQATAPAGGLTTADVQDAYRYRYEFRLGGYDHAVFSSREGGSADVNMEFVLPDFWPTTWTVPRWLLPRPQLGATLNTDGKTSYAYAGALWTVDFTRSLFGEGFFGGMVHDAPLNDDRTRLVLGCRFLFHEGLSLGYRITDRWSVMSTIEHSSNASGTLTDCPKNEGITEIGARLGYSF
jgi:hypothetical protein